MGSSPVYDGGASDYAKEEKMEYLIVSFRSRAETMRFVDILRGMGAEVAVVNTPREAYVGCGLSARLNFSPFSENEGAFYHALATDDALNRHWGYDYREDIAEKDASPARFMAFLKELALKKEEFSFAVRLGSRPIGEVVLHNFDYHGGVEIGCRIAPSAQKNGYGRESFAAAARYAKEALSARRLKAKCRKENAASRRMIIACGFQPAGEDETYFYFGKS